MYRKSCTGLQLEYQIFLCFAVHAWDKLSIILNNGCALNFWPCKKFLLTKLNIEFLLYCFFFVKTFDSSKSETNEEVTKTVMDAIVADHMGTEKCPWSVAEMKGMNNE